MDSKKATPITRNPNEGEYVSVVGDTYRILVSGSDTDGAFAQIDMLIPPGGGPGPHAHADFDESFYVIDGEIEVKHESGSFIAAKGAFVNIPKGGTVHCFKNKSDKTAHLLCTVTPAGLEEFFREIGEPVSQGEFLPLPTFSKEFVSKLQIVAERYGQKVFPPDYLG